MILIIHLDCNIANMFSHYRVTSEEMAHLPTINSPDMADDYIYANLRLTYYIMLGQLLIVTLDVIQTLDLGGEEMECGRVSLRSPKEFPPAVKFGVCGFILIAAYQPCFIFFFWKRRADLLTYISTDKVKNQTFCTRLRPKPSYYHLHVLQMG